MIVLQHSLTLIGFYSQLQEAYNGWLSHFLYFLFIYLCFFLNATHQLTVNYLRHDTMHPHTGLRSSHAIKKISARVQESYSEAREGGKEGGGMRRGRWWDIKEWEREGTSS